MAVATKYEYSVGETIHAVYHDNLPISGIVLSSRQQWRGNGYPSATLYTVKPDRPVMGETEIRESVLFDQEMIGG